MFHHFKFVYTCYIDVWHHVDMNVTPRRRTAFPVKVAKIRVSCSPLPGMKSTMRSSTQIPTIICIFILICMTTQHSEPGNKPPHLLSIYSLHAQWNKGEHEKKLVLTKLNSMDPDQVRHFVGPNSGSNHLPFMNNYISEQRKIVQKDERPKLFSKGTQFDYSKV